MGATGSSAAVGPDPRCPTRRPTRVLDEDDDSCSSSGSSSDGEGRVDRLASASRTGVLLEVMLPRQQECKPVLKSALTEDWEGPEDQFTPQTVLLHVYDLEDCREANHLLSFALDEVSLGGAFHTGVEVYGGEWSYGTFGVKCEVPRTASGHIYRCTVPLGTTGLSAREVATILHEIVQEWRGNDYDLLTQNCCSFSAEFCHRLGVEGLPGWVDRFARILGAGKKAARATAVATRDAARATAEAAKATAAVGQHVGRALRQMSESFAMEMSESFAVEAPLMPRLLEDSGFEAPGTISVRGQEIYMSYEGDGGRRRESPVAPSRLCLATVKVEPGQAGEEEFPAGTAVEYESASAGRWIGAKVLFRRPSGLYDLDVKPMVAPCSIRRPRAKPSRNRRRSNRRSTGGLSGADEPRTPGLKAVPEEAAAGPGRAPGAPPRKSPLDVGAALVGAQVEYRSASNGGWVPAKVLSFHSASGLYDLDCRGQVPASSMRVPGGAAAAEGAKENSSAGGNGDLPASAALGHSIFPVGSSVEYLSVSLGCWVPGKVLQFHAAGGLYDLDCKAQVPAERLRWPAAPRAPSPEEPAPKGLGFGGQEGGVFPIGAVVEYQSTSTGCWIPAKVLGYHAPSGLYDLDCRPQAVPSRIRWPSGNASAAPHGSPRAAPHGSPRAAPHGSPLAAPHGSPLAVLFSGPDDVPAH